MSNKIVDRAAMYVAHKKFLLSEIQFFQFWLIFLLKHPSDSIGTMVDQSDPAGMIFNPLTLVFHLCFICLVSLSTVGIKMERAVSFKN